MTQTDTIVAQATVSGRGAIAIVRLSGARAVEIAKRVAIPFPGTPRMATLATLGANATETADGTNPQEIIDHALVTWFAAPASYTGEDVVEFAVHGGALVSTLLIEACVRAGARPALAGEFTERAVLHGKMDLVQAEAVADLIDARTRAAHRAAVRQLDGALSQRLLAMRDAMLGVDALIAYDIDFPAEDDGAISRARVVAACDEAIEQVERLLATLPAAALGREGALVVLAGPPNAGKSALLNALVGESRVIVSEIPGTTRDAVEVFVDDTPYPLRLVDTAGLRSSGDVLERMGIEVSERYLARADLVLVCAEGAEELDAACAAVTRLSSGAVVRVLTKADIYGLTTENTEEHGVRQKGTERHGIAQKGTDSDERRGYVSVSAITGEGLDVLRARIRAVLRERVTPPADDMPVITRARHEQALRVAVGELRAFRLAWESAALPAPVAATHLRAAVTALEGLIGAVDVEDVLERVFRAFCIGK